MQCLHQDCTMVLTIEKEMRGSTPFRLAMFLVRVVAGSARAHQKNHGCLS